MNNGTNWQERNARYLAASLAWLRSSMEQFASEQQEKSGPIILPVPRPKEEPKSIWRHFAGRSPELPPRTPNLLLTGSATRDNDEVAQAAAAMQAAAEMDPPPALLILVQRLGLSQFEQQLLLLCLGMELDTGIAGLCARCQKDSARAFPTFALAFALFEGASWEALSPERPLRF